MKIRIITTGGTIDKIYFDKLSEYKVGDSHIAEVLREANVSFEFDVISLMKKDSLDLTDEDRMLIRQTIESDSHRHIVVTHGTDTMVETAKALMRIKNKVIVLTGAMQPAIFRQTDAVFNIGCAVTAVQLAPEGVWITMNGMLLDPNQIRKNHQKHCFEMIDC